MLLFPSWLEKTYNIPLNPDAFCQPDMIYSYPGTSFEKLEAWKCEVHAIHLPSCKCMSTFLEVAILDMFTLIMFWLFELHMVSVGRRRVHVGRVAIGESYGPFLP